MTVNELIDNLKEFNGELEVFLGGEALRHVIVEKYEGCPEYVLLDC